jgi:riboflavin kinase
MLINTALALLLKVANLKEETSTVTLAEEIGISQQSASRVLSELAKKELIRKRILARGLQLELTGKGRLELLTLQGKLNEALGNGGVTALKGIYTKGMGEGKYYVSLPEYSKPISKELGKEPFPGTLNLHVNPEERSLFLARIASTKISGFSTTRRTYGDVKFYPITIGGHDAGLLLPERTSYGPDKVEIVATLELRRALSIKEGDDVVIERRGEQ